MKSHNFKNNIKKNFSNLNKNRKKLSTSNGQMMSRLKRLKHGNLRNRKEKNKNWEKKKNKRKQIKKRPNKVKRNRVKLLSKSPNFKEKNSTETKRKSMPVHSWFNIVKTLVQPVAKLSINLVCKSNLSLRRSWKKESGQRWRMLKLFKARKREVRKRLNKRQVRRDKAKHQHNSNRQTDSHTLILWLKCLIQWRFYLRQRLKIWRSWSMSCKTRWSTSSLIQTNRSVSPYCQPESRRDRPRERAEEESSTQRSSQVSTDWFVSMI